MNAAQFFMLRYEPLHTTMTDRLVGDLSDAQLRARPHGQNSIAWLLWHVARAEDIGINRFAMDGREVFDEGGWATRLGTGRREVGTAMTSDEVSDLTTRVSVAALRAYWDAVGQRTLDIIRTYDTTEWDKVVDPGRIRRVVRDEGGFGPHVNTARASRARARDGDTPFPGPFPPRDRGAPLTLRPRGSKAAFCQFRGSSRLPACRAQGQPSRLRTTFPSKKCPHVWVSASWANAQPRVIPA